MALQGFDSAYYLAQKFAALQAAETEWATRTQADLENILTNIYGGTAATAAEAHYSEFGFAENIGPNAFFNATEYKAAKAKAMFNDPASTFLTEEEALAAFNAAWPFDSYLHYLAYGSAEGINPSNAFDESSYLDTKLAALQADSTTAAEWAGKTAADVKAAFTAAGLTALGHYIAYGQNETGVTVTVVPDSEKVTSGSSTVGSTFSLTQATDTIMGTINNDTINAFVDGGVPTLGPIDTIDGAGGEDTLNAFGIDLDNVTPANITNVEKFVFQSTSAGTLDMSQITGETSITDQSSTASATFTGLTTGTELSVQARSAGTTTFTYGATALAGSTDAVTLNLMGTTGTVTIAGSVASTNALETLTINSMGSANTLAAFTNIAGLATLNITGSAALDIDATALGASTTTVDASAMTAATSILASAAAAGFTYTGGTGDDVLNLQAALAGTQTINGGDGTDTLIVDSAITSGETAKVTNFEILGVDANAGAFTQDMDFFAVDTASILVNGGTVTFSDVADGFTINANVTMGGGEDIVANLKSDTASDDITINVGGTAGGVTLIGIDPDTRYETVTVNSQGTAGNTIGNIGTAVNNMVFTGSTALTITSTTSLTGVADFSAMTGVANATTSTTSLTVLGGSANDVFATGVIANGQTQVISGGEGNDTVTSGNLAAGATLTVNGGAGEDVINFNAANTGASVHNVDGGAGFDTITLGQHAGTVDTVISTVTTTADADRVTGFLLAADSFDYNGTVKNDSNTAIVGVINATLAGGLAADADATAYLVSTALTGAAATAGTALAAATTASTVASTYATFEEALATSLGTVANLDTTLTADESVLLSVDDGTNGFILRFTNTDTSVANTVTADELELVAVMVGADDMLVADFA